MDVNNQMTFLLGAHKSGTSLLRSLLDGHSDLNVLPIETHPFQHLGYTITYSLRQQQRKKRSVCEIKESMRQWIAYCNSSTGKSGGSYSFGFFDEEIFDRSVEGICERDSVREILIRYWDSILKATRNYEYKPSGQIVEKSVENGAFVPELMQLFPNAKFVHILRNPYDNLVSLRKYTSLDSGRYPSLRNMLISLRQNFDYIERNLRLLEDSYLLVRYEDLVSDPDEQLKKICNFLDIEFQPSLLMPTLSGESWKGNSSAGVEFEGISKERLDKWKVEINSMEIDFINRACGHRLPMHGYEAIEAKPYIFPHKKEGLKIYTYNRILRYYIG
jgi:protein-tyrosine sulfotransferase